MPVATRSQSRSKARPKPTTVSTNGLELLVAWGDDNPQSSSPSNFPAIYLRDNCRCRRCFHQSSQSRLTSFHTLDQNCSISAAELDATQGSAVVHVAWKDGHSSEYPLQWLKMRSFDESSRRKRRDAMLLSDAMAAACKGKTGRTSTLFSNPHLRLWGAREMSGNIPRFDLKDLLEHDAAMLDWCLTLETHGLAVVTAGAREGELKRFTDRFGHRDWSAYGEFFAVENKANPNNLSYTPANLQFHTDLPNYTTPPQVQMLHFVAQSSDGGENVFVDGFDVARQILESSKSDYELLRTVELSYQDNITETLYDADEGSDATKQQQLNSRTVSFSLHATHPIIKTDPNDHNRILQINYSDHHRDSSLDVPVEKVRPFYSACKTFDTLLHSPKNKLISKAKPGDIICFNNMRVLHGRQGFPSSQKRKLVGTYLRWDEIRSMARTKARKLQETNDTECEKQQQQEQKQGQGQSRNQGKRDRKSQSGTTARKLRRRN